MKKVLIVDDSLFMRTMISEIIEGDSLLSVVGTAKDGKEALEKVAKLHPDCLTLDLKMPGWDGLTTLKKIMSDYPTPVVILSAYSKEDAEITFQCLKSGAVGFVLKPSGELSLDINVVKEKILEEVKAAASFTLAKLRSLVKLEEKPLHPSPISAKKTKIILIGASTGGPQTIINLIESLPYSFKIPIIIIQHLPDHFFTHSFASQLEKSSRLPVKEATDKEVIQESTIYLVPGKCSLGINPDMKFMLLKENKQLSPNIDEVMISFAKVWGSHTLGVILTGMGDDGVEGMKQIQESGGMTIAQDESSLIYGMPKAVWEAGYAKKKMSLEEIRNYLISLN